MEWHCLSTYRDRNSALSSGIRKKYFLNKVMILKSINKVIKVLILSDVALLTGFGFVTPIFAIFLTENIEGGNIEVAGFAAAIYWIVMSSVVIPLGKYLDKTQGEKDDLWFIVLGNLLAAFAVFGYIFSKLPWHIYLLQAIYAIGMGMNIPGYTALFTRHVDKGREALSWSIRAALIGVGTGVAGALGGIIAYRFGFITLFTAVGIIILFSAVLPLFISKEMFPRDKTMPKIPGIKTVHPPTSKE
jgi:DHA1 family quinolone resistance protein-like MFS transporter